MFTYPVELLHRREVKGCDQQNGRGLLIPSFALRLYQRINRGVFGISSEPVPPDLNGEGIVFLES
jgi:hypothetical protein